MLGFLPVFPPESAQALRDLCQLSCEHPGSAFLVIGGSAERFGIDNPRFNEQIRELVKWARSCGTPCKRGNVFWNALAPWANQPGGCHHEEPRPGFPATHFYDFVEKDGGLRQKYLLSSTRTGPGMMNALREYWEDKLTQFPVNTGFMEAGVAHTLDDPVPVMGASEARASTVVPPPTGGNAGEEGGGSRCRAQPSRHPNRRRPLRLLRRSPSRKRVPSWPVLMFRPALVLDPSGREHSACARRHPRRGAALESVSDLSRRPAVTLGSLQDLSLTPTWTRSGLGCRQRVWGSIPWRARLSSCSTLSTRLGSKLRTPSR
jgi:hypothetical protein